MKTFDYQQVGAVLGPLKARFVDCAHGEGDKCEMIDRQLECCAAICSDVAKALREWALGVFSGEIVFDPAAENLWRSEVNQIYTQAIRVWQLGRKAEVPCWELAGQNKLASALWDLHWLLDKWVTPKLSVGPSARVNLKLDSDHLAAIRSQLSKLQ
jgi:hypothetical protein